MTRRVILPDFFQLYKAARICHHHKFRGRPSLRSQQGIATSRLFSKWW